MDKTNKIKIRRVDILDRSLFLAYTIYYTFKFLVEGFLLGSISFALLFGVTLAIWVIDWELETIHKK